MKPAPGAIPGPDTRAESGVWMSHRRDAAIEDVRFLTATGVQLEQALDRVGVTRAAWASWHVDLDPTTVHPIHHELTRGRKAHGSTAA